MRPSPSSSITASLLLWPLLVVPAAWTQPATAAMTIRVKVPSNTPSSDTVWMMDGLALSVLTHVKMSRVAGTQDTWEGSVSAAEGTIVRFFFNRNDDWSKQEAYDGGAANPRQVLMTNGTIVEETVGRWPDIEPLANATGTLAGAATDPDGNPLMGIRVSAGPQHTVTDSNGEYFIFGVPAGAGSITFRSDNGEFRTARLAATIAPNATTRQDVTLTAAPLSPVTFTVTVPADTPAAAVPRLYGDTYSLGMMDFTTDSTRVIDMTRLEGNRWTFSTRLGIGACVNYLYTLGSTGLNFEKDSAGRNVTRWLCVKGDTTVNDTVTAWKTPRQVPVSLAVTSPTGADDSLYVAIDPAGYAPVKMWPAGAGKATYTVYAEPSTSLSYHYVRNGDHAIGPEILGTDSNPPAYRSLAVGAGGTASDDTVTAWRHQMREGAETSVGTGATLPVVSRPADSPFQTGVELADYWNTQWFPLITPTMTRLQSKNVQWVQIPSVWGVAGGDNPRIVREGATYPPGDLLAHIRAAKAQGLKVALKSFPFGDFFQSTHSNAWFDQFFQQYQSVALYHAKIARQEGIEMLILGNYWWEGIDNAADPATRRYINAKWKDVIAAIRAGGYEGPLTIDLLVNMPEYDWYGELDYLGDKWWWPVASGTDGSVQSMYDAAVARLSYYEPIAKRFRKPFVFSEIAYYSARTSASQTYNVNSPQISDWIPEDPTVPSDYDEQGRACQAVLLALANTPWVQGVYSFNYAYFNFDSKGYSVRAKTAEEIMSRIYRQINAATDAAGRSALANSSSSPGLSSLPTFPLQVARGIEMPVPARER